VVVGRPPHARARAAATALTYLPALGERAHGDRARSLGVGRAHNRARGAIYAAVSARPLLRVT
jgi:hypothetical protein